MLRRIVLIGTAAAAVVLSGCGDDGGGDADGTTTTTTQEAAAAATITIEDFAFEVAPASPGAISVTNRDDSAHTVTADDGSFDVEVPGGSEATVQVAEPGQYPFHCTIHSSMTGTLDVS